MKLRTDVTLKLDYEEAKALTHLLGALTLHTERELGLSDDEIAITDGIFALLADLAVSDGD